MVVVTGALIIVSSFIFARVTSKVSNEPRYAARQVENAKSGKLSDMFSINAMRTPQFMIDIDIQNLQLSDLKKLPRDTGWGTVPTPVF
jgi:hypothetical protein